MKRALAAVLLVGLAAGPTLAQEAPRPAAPRSPRAPESAKAPQPPLRADGLPNYDANAPETQQRLQQLLQQYPPSLGQVLALDPTLLTNPAYLEPYPLLGAFLAQHPEIAHNPSYFLPRYRDFGPRYDYNDPKLAAMRTVGEALAGLAFLIGFLTVVGTIGWLLRTVIEHRKWSRVSKTHTDTHTKLMDRLTSNEDLIAYMQSPAGQRFLNAAPIPVDNGPRMLAAPFGRILWSVQAGIVIAFVGAAVIYASTRFAGNETFSDAELPLFVVGAAAMAIGAGFFISAFVAYGLSRRLGLFPSGQPAAADLGTGPTQ
jgi:hypothetical protein